MAMTTLAAYNPRRGIALLVTVIFMSVMLAFGLALASLAYKQSVLSSITVQSQAAFYAADSTLECLLYADQQEGDFTYGDYNSLTQPNGPDLLDKVASICHATRMTSPAATGSWDATRLAVSGRLLLNGGKSCADVVIYKYANAIEDRKTFLFATGYNVPCATLSVPGARTVVRGIDASY